LLVVTLLFGCGPKIPPVDFATISVASLNAELAAGAALAPGGKTNLVVTLTAPDGTQWATDGSRAHKLPWETLAVNAELVTVNKKGQVMLPRDPRQIHGDFGHVAVTMPSHPDLHAEVDVPLRFNLRDRADFSGTRGLDGSDGLNGNDGVRGTDGSLDPENRTAGGNGSDGSNGQNGNDGNTGGDAANVNVQLAMHPNGRLIEAEVLSSRFDTQYFLIDPQGGSLWISANGGDGGRGGRGGRGGSGGTGWPPGMSGHDGLNGQDGQTGHQGRGGQITVSYDPAVEPYLDKTGRGRSLSPARSVHSGRTTPLRRLPLPAPARVQD